MGRNQCIGWDFTTNGMGGTGMIIGCEKKNWTAEGICWKEEGEQICSGQYPAEYVISGFCGKYTLCVEVMPSKESSFLLVFQDGEEIGAFAVPYTGNIDRFGRYKPVKPGVSHEDKKKAVEILKANEENTRKIAKSYVFEIPCILHGEKAVFQIASVVSYLNDSMKTYNGADVLIRRVSLKEGIVTPKSFFERMRPGKNLVDLWGWMSMTSFEHPAERVTPFDEQAERGIKEAYTWGANNFEFLPVNQDGMALELEEEAWDGREKYLMSKDTTWTPEKVRKLIRMAKEYGMLTEFFLYCLHGAGFIDTNMNWKEKTALFQQIVKNYSNCREESKADEMVDGIITEAWYPIDAPEYLKGAWKWNPGLFHLISNNDGAQYDIHNAGYTPATHAYSAHWPGFDTQHTGYDHAYPILPYPKDFYTNREGKLFTYMQGCGQTCHPRKKFPRIEDIPLGITNRTVSPDWIVAQTHQFGLRNLWDETDHLAMAFCWEADEQTMCPEEARRYVYAASQDPVRLAACYPLSDTGTGGELDLKRNTRRVHREEQTRLRKRSKYPATSIVNGNRFIQLISLSEREETILQCDTSESGTFYNHGAVTELAFPFLITRFSDNRFLEKEVEITECAGPMAVLTEKSRLGSGFVTLTQQVRYEIYGELPMVCAKIERKMEPGKRETIETILGMRDYTHCRIHENTIHVWDEYGILPDAFIWVEGNWEEIGWRKGTGIFIRETVSGSQSMDITVCFQMGDYKNASLKQMKKIQEQSVQWVEYKEEMTVENTTDLPLPVTVIIRHAQEIPYWVKENQIWQHRGAARMKEHMGCSSLKLYLQPKEKGVIRPYGFLEQEVRPGRGCQNVLGIRSVERKENKIYVSVLVEAENPMLSSVVLECRKPIGTVWLDGIDYHYFSGNQVFLPQGKRVYELVIEPGQKKEPQLLMTYGQVTECSFNQKEEIMCVNMKDQPWVNPQAGISYKMVIKRNGRRIRDVSGGVLLEESGDLSLLEATSGILTLILKNIEK